MISDFHSKPSTVNSQLSTKMIYRFTIISDEVDGFMREIQIDADAKFLELHKLILEACGYEDNQMTSFTDGRRDRKSRSKKWIPMPTKTATSWLKLN